MTIKTLKLAFIILLVCSYNNSYGQHIKRKGNLGVQMANAPKNPHEAIFSIASVFPNSTASNLNLKKDDLLLKINGSPATSYSDVKTLISKFYGDDDVSITVLRDHKITTLKGKVQAKAPVKVSQNSETILGEVPYKNGYIRSILNKPTGNGPFKTIYYIQGYPCQSVDYPIQHPTMQLIKGLVEEGYAVYRVEKPGAGEFVNCEPCQDQDFNDDLTGFINGYNTLTSYNFIDTDNIYLFGHSLGGNVASLLANQKPVTGIISYGTSVKPWTDYLLDMARYSQPMMDGNYKTSEEQVKKLRAINDKIYKDTPISALSDSEKETLKLLNDYDGNGSIFGRKFSFWKNFNTIDFINAWGGVKTNVLSLYGNSDLHAISALDAQHIANIVNSVRPGTATFKRIDQTDHYFAKVESKQQEAYLLTSGKINEIIFSKFNSEVINVVTNWIESPIDEYQEPLFKDATALIDIEKTKMSTMDVESADLDGDGDKDLILATEFGPNRILFNDSGNFKENPTKTLPQLKTYTYPYMGEDSEDIAIADFDNDGHLDLLFVSEDTEHHELYFNNGKGKFELADQQIPKNDHANAVLVYDFNKDSFPDILIGNRTQNELFINQKNRSFKNETSKYWLINTDATQDLIKTDIDNDGDMDIVEGIEQGGNNIYINNNGTFKESNDRIPDMSQIETRKVVAADVDNDGDMDLFYCNVGWTGKNPQNILLLNDGKGYFTNATTTALPNDLSTTLDAIIKDFNNDGKPDILTTGLNDINNLKLFINTSNGSAITFEKAKQLLPNIQYNGGIAMIADEFTTGNYGIYLGNSKHADFLIELNSTNTSLNN